MNSQTAAPSPELSPEPLRARLPILSEASRHPLHLLWICVLPQVLLLLLNLHSLGIIWGEMDSAQRVLGRSLVGTELAMMLVVGALVGGLHYLGRRVAWALYWPLLAMPVAYLWFVFAGANTMIPDSVSAWILPASSFLYYQFAFVMPAAFFAAMQLACFNNQERRVVDVGLTISVLLGFPGAMWLFFKLMATVGMSWHLPLPIMAAVMVIATLGMLGALLRLTVMAYVGARRKGPITLAILNTFVALVLPIGGLLLNRKIAFPADFQTTGVYAVLVLNAALLLLPNFRSLPLHRAVWLAQCALFPFTLYFFVVFLPFLPLSLLAMIAFGAGFLMLAPTALFILHGQRILDGFRNEVRDGGRLIPAVLGVAALSALPLAYTVQAMRDRQVLGHAIAFAYSPDFRSSGFPGTPQTIGRTLGELRDFKAGIQLPFIADYYNWLVFGGLVLPDEKMDHLHRLFLGDKLPEPTRRLGNDFFGAEERGGRRRGVFSEGGGAARPFPHEVRMASATPISEPEDAQTVRTRLTLQLQNSTALESEFVTNLHVPEGVLISGFWLNINGERVPARIFEKKSALWVYQKIRDVTRRDPGILFYTGAETLELHVFPVGAQETRTVELEFLRPATLAAAVQIGAQTYPLGTTTATPQVALAAGGGGGAVLSVPAGALVALPQLTRRPYLHFIVDRSAGSSLEGAPLREALERLAREFPTAQEYAITAANFDAVELTDGLRALATLPTWDAQRLATLPKQGGFAQDRALKRVLLQSADDLASARPGALGRFAIPIIVRGRSSAPVTENEVEDFGKIAPDLGGYFVSIDGDAPTARSWNDRAQPAAFTPTQAPRAVVLFKLGAAVFPVAADVRAPILLPLFGGNGMLQMWNAAAGAWQPAPHAEIAPNSRYAGGLSAWLQQEALVQEPARGPEAFRRLVAASRAAGVIVPATSYIVVENSAQWRKLEEAEKKKLAGNAALELEETPEPTTALLLLVGGGALLARRRRILG